MFENSVLGRMFGLKSDEEQEARENCIMMDFIICALHDIPVGC